MIYAGIVFYNKRIRDSKLIPMLTAEGFVPVVYDNSDREEFTEDNRNFCGDNGYLYLGNGANRGVSFAYTEIVNAIKSKGQKENSWVAMFDDDSEVTKGYFENARNIASNEENAGICLPIVKLKDGRIVSPSRITRLKDFKLFESKEEALSYVGNGITGINSGMLINLSIFDRIAYDTRLFIDNIDHAFIDKVKKAGIGIRVFDGEIIHSLTEFELPGMESVKVRFKHFLSDCRYYYPRGVRFYHIARRTLKYTLKYRTFAFIRMALSKTLEV